MADHHRQTTVGEVNEDITPLPDSGSENSGIVEGIIGDAGKTISAPSTAKSTKVDVRSQNAIKLERQLVWAHGLTL